MKVKTIFASAAIVATMAAQNAQLVSAVTTDADNSSEKPLDVNNDVTGNQTSDSINNTDESSSVKDNDSDSVVADPSDDSKTTTDTTDQTPAVPKTKVESTGSLGPGFYDKSTVKVAAATTRAAANFSAVNTTALQVMPVNVNTSAFINKISAGAISGWQKYKILPSVTMAQAILESGWGASTLTTKANNLFGIKGRYNGQYVVMSTQEQDRYGNVYTVKAEFRKYPSQKESMEDHGNFLTVNSRYRNLIGKTNYKEVTRLLQQDGYATATTYASSLNRIIETYGLTKYDNQSSSNGNNNNSNNANPVVGTPISGTRYISNINGASIYSAPNGKTTGRVLAFGTNWKIDRVYTSNNSTWYRVGGNMWVKGSDVSTGKPSKPNTNKPNSDKPAPKATSGIRYVKNTNGTKLYNSPYSDKKSLNRTLGYKTAWRVDQVVTVDGQTWYRVGKNQWVNNADLSTSKPGNSTPAKPNKPSKPNNPAKPSNPTPSHTSGVKYIQNTSGAKLYNSPFNGKKYLGRTLAYKTAWKVDQVVTVSGQTWYRVGSNQWVNNADLVAKPTEKVVKTVKTVKSNSGARVYKNHATNTASNRVLKKNTAWKVDREFTSGGQLWYRVGSGAWVRSSDMK